MKKFLVTLSAITLLALGTASTLFAQTSTVNGRITAVTENTMTITTDSGQPMTFKIEDENVPAAVRVNGNRVSVTYVVDGSDLKASTVMLTSAASATVVTTIGGTVVSSTPSAIVVTTDAGERMTFLVNDPGIVPTSVVAGNRVRVTYNLDGTANRASVVALDATPYSSTDTYATTTRTSTYNDRLPATGSSEPLLVLAGLLALGAAAAVRLASKS